MRIVGIAVFLIAVLLTPATVSAASPIYSIDANGKMANPPLPDHTVILTFDDGPSQYTPQILKILKDHGVHATFFVVGSQVESNPILKTIYDDGNDIGNHTYSHANLSDLPAWQTQLELSLDRLIIESQTGHSTRILRPPYLGSDVPSAQSTDLINSVGKQGYITVGENIDTEDWRKPGENYIVFNATTEAKSQAKGGIILMHDGGGDRSQTVKALPIIIGYYLSQDYRFLTVSQALGLPRDQLMPPAGKGDIVLYHLAAALFTLQSFVSKVFLYVIFLLIVASFGRMIIVLVVANIQARRKLPRLADGTVPCSVIVPAYNESAVIQSCLKSVLASDYHEFEVLVVDDGSTDDTVELAESSDDHRVKVLRKQNGGKASALNYGVEHAKNDFIIAIDADTVFQPQTLRQLMRHFDRVNVGAVSGNTRIVNRHNLITKLQSLEYIVGFNLDRRMGDFFDCITVVPGAIGAFRKSALIKAGGFTLDTLAEDTDLTLAIKEARYRIIYDAEAVAYTEAPATVRELLKQRFRWTFGTMQAVWKHRRAIGNPRYGTLGLVGLPYLLLYQIIFPLMGPFFDIALIIGLLNQRYGLVLVSFAIYTAADIIMSAVAIRLDREKQRQLWLLIPQRLFYRQLMYYVIVRSTMNVLRGNLVGWGSLKRSGKHLAKANE